MGIPLSGRIKKGRLDGQTPLVQLLPATTSYYHKATVVKMSNTLILQVTWPSILAYEPLFRRLLLPASIVFC